MDHSIGASGLSRTLLPFVFKPLIATRRSVLFYFLSASTCSGWLLSLAEIEISGKGKLSTADCRYRHSMSHSNLESGLWKVSGLELDLKLDLLHVLDSGENLRGMTFFEVEKGSTLDILDPL